MLAPEHDSKASLSKCTGLVHLGTLPLSPVPAAGAGPQNKLLPDPKQPGNCVPTATSAKAQNGSFYGVAAVLQKRCQYSSSPNLGQGQGPCGGSQDAAAVTALRNALTVPVSAASC